MTAYPFLAFVHVLAALAGIARGSRSAATTAA